MKEAYNRNQLGRAAVEGDIDGERKSISTASHGKAQYKNLAVNSKGNVDHAAARDHFFEVLGKMGVSGEPVLERGLVEWFGRMLRLGTVDVRSESRTELRPTRRRQRLS